MHPYQFTAYLLYLVILLNVIIIVLVLQLKRKE